MSRKAPLGGQGRQLAAAAMVSTGLGLLAAGAFIATRGPVVPDIPPVILLLSDSAVLALPPPQAIVVADASAVVPTDAEVPDGANQRAAPRAPAPDLSPASPPPPPEPPAPEPPAPESPAPEPPAPEPSIAAAQDQTAGAPSAEALPIADLPPTVVLLGTRPQEFAPTRSAAPPAVMDRPEAARSDPAPPSSLPPALSLATPDNAPPPASPPTAAPIAAIDPPVTDRPSDAREEPVSADDVSPVVLSPETGAPGSVPAPSRPADLGRAPPAGAPAADARLVAAASAAFEADPPRQLLRVGVFGVEANAIRIAERLTLEGIAVRVGRIAREEGQVWQVLAGPATDRADALRLLRLVAALGITDAYFVGP